MVAAGDRRPVWERLSRQEAVAGGVDPVEEGAETAAIAAGMAFAAAVEGAALRLVIKKRAQTPF